jgi:hypothetical protein
MSAIEGKTTAVSTVGETLPPQERKRSYGTLEPDGENSDANNPFLDQEVAEYWRTVYEKAQYECRHVFDPSLTWTAEEEKAIVRKLDWRICLWAVCYDLTLSRRKQQKLIAVLFYHSVLCFLRCRLIGEILFRRFLIPF